MITVDIDGASAVIQATVSKTVEDVNKQVISRATRALNYLRNAELEVLKGQRSGRLYKKPGGGTYRASAPGEPPAVRTGNLRLSWSMDVQTEGSMNGSMTVKPELISNAEYATYLENGTSRSAPRPFVDKIKEQAMPDIVRIYKEPY